MLALAPPCPSPPVPATDAAMPRGPVRGRWHRAHSEVDLLWIAGKLGLLHYKERRTIIAKVRLLAEQSNFPLPKNPRFVSGKRITGAQSIDANSIWDRDPVDLWLDGDRPPAESAALVTQRRTDVAEEMRARALQLVAVNA
jgi:hypothetical protein